ncbi:MAG TPA: dTMP kinase [Thermoplasmata archaeon]|nr:dTMP kinase [Thermoplasmata archaeon]
MTGRRRSGGLIVLEGIDGAGKSTLQRRLALRWRARGWRVVLSREPHDPDLGRAAQVRGAKDPLAGGLLFTLDRALAAADTERAMRKGALVLQDRSYFSTIAYQGSALAPGERLALMLLQRHLTPEPDRVLWLDLLPVEALDRLRARGSRRAPFETMATLRRVRAAYRRLARDPRWIRLDARVPPDQLAELADRALARFLSTRRPVRAPRS